MRAPGRVQFPDFDRFLREVNETLAASGLPVCHRLEPVADGDTANPNAVGHANGRKYVIKVSQRHPKTLQEQLELANAIRARTVLPIPEHLCYSSYHEGRLPLMIMEWLPGKQLQTALPAASGERLRCLLRNLAKCLAIFHHPDHLPLVVGRSTGQGFAEWWLGRIENQLDKDRIPKGVSTRMVREFLAARMSAMRAFAVPSLTKADQDLRDFLVADDETGDITGMLDWERVDAGDAIYEVSVIFLRLWLADKAEAWGSFCEAYNSAAVTGVFQCPQAEYYLMCRSVLASGHSDRAGELVRLLLEGKPMPFGRTDVDRSPEQGTAPDENSVAVHRRR